MVFYDPRFHMTVFGRFLVRITSYSSYLLIIALAITMILSEAPWMITIGIFFILCIVDRMYRRRKADQELSWLPSTGIVNVAPSLKPATFSYLERAYDRSIMLHHDLALELMLQLLSDHNVKHILHEAEVPPAEFRAKAEEFARNSFETASLSAPSDRRRLLEALVVRAGTIALEDRHEAIEPQDLFEAIQDQAKDYTERLITAFGIARKKKPVGSATI